MLTGIGYVVVNLVSKKKFGLYVPKSYTWQVRRAIVEGSALIWTALFAAQRYSALPFVSTEGRKLRGRAGDSEEE